MEEMQGKSEFIKYLLEGNNAMVRGDLDTAVLSYNKAISLNPGFALTYSKLGEAYYKKKEFDEAINCFKQALDLDPKQTETLYRLGKAYGESGMLIQSAVAFDMARERDPEGDFAERIDDSQQRIRRRSTHKSVRRPPMLEVLADALRNIVTHPGIFIPAAAATVVMLLADRLLVLILKRLMTGPPPSSLAAYFFGSGSAPGYSTIAYYAIQIFVFSMLCSPFYGMVIVLIKRLSRDRDAIFGDAVQDAFQSYSSLAGAALMLVVSVAALAAVVDLLFNSFSMMALELGTVKFSFRPLVIPVALLPLGYYYYVPSVIVIDRKTMEKSFKKASTLGSKLYWRTLVMIYVYVAAHVALTTFAGGRSIALRAAAFALIVFAQTLLVALLTVNHLKSQKSRRRKKSESSRKKSAAHALSGDYFEEEYPDNRELYEYTDKEKK